jgi:predicted helicase
VQETWTLNTQHPNKLLANDIDIYIRSARKGNFQNDTIRTTMDVENNVLGVIEDKRLG